MLEKVSEARHDVSLTTVHCSMQRSSAILQGRSCYCNTLLAEVSAGQQSLCLSSENALVSPAILTSGYLAKSNNVSVSQSERYAVTLLHTVLTIRQLLPCKLKKIYISKGMSGLI